MCQPIRTVADDGSAAFEVKGSTFYGFIRPVSDEASVARDREAITSEYPDATHHVIAYRLRADPLIEWSTDDGEPSGSAGKPTLHVLQAESLENVLAVIVRYYGGTNLGYGGLVRAYSRCTRRALDDAGIVEREPTTRVQLESDYNDAGTIRSILESESVDFEANYAETVSFRIDVPSADVNAIIDRLRSATSDRIDIDR